MLVIFRNTGKLFIASLSAGAGVSTLAGLLQARGYDCKELLVRTGTAQMEADAAGVSQHDRSDPDEFIADGCTGRMSKPSVFQSNPADVVEQHISHGAQQQPELVGPPVVAAGSIRVQIQLLFFDPVLHVAARTVSFVVKRLRIAVERGNDKARVAPHRAVPGKEAVCDALSGPGGQKKMAGILPDIGEALVDYIQHGRESASRALFVSVIHPYHFFANSVMIGHIVKEAFTKTGLDLPPRAGGYILRHSLATNLVRQGTSLEEISNLLRHRSRPTALLYAKMDVNGLRSVALPWPKGGAK